MKKHLIILLVSLLGLYPSCHGKEKEQTKIVDKSKTWIYPDSIIFSQLGETLTDILFNPKSVVCYSIEREDSVNNYQLEPYFKKGELVRKLSKEEITIIKYSLLANPDNYVNDTLVVMSPYIPRLDFEFTGRKGKKARVLVSLSDNSWSVLFDGKKQFRFNNHSRDMKRLCNYYIQEEKNRQSAKKEKTETK